MKNKDQMLLENLYNSVSLHGWMDPNGKMISNQGYQRHLDTAIEILKNLYQLTKKQIFIEITPENIFEYLFAKQWLRITYSGPIIYCNNTIRPPTQKQLNELKNLCIEFNKTGITWDNDTEDKVLWTKDDLMEAYYDSRKPPINKPSKFGYFDADKLLGKRVWVHTNLTNRSKGRNGMFGVYIPTTKDGKETLSDERYGYTNEIRLTNISFDVDIPCVQGIINRNKRTICAGIIGTVVKTEGNTSGFEEFTFNPFTKVFGYYRKNDSEMKILTGADEVYLNSLEDGKYIILGKGLKTE